MSESNEVVLLTEIRNWVRAAAYPTVKELLKEALPDAAMRQAYQMCDGKNTRDAICKTCKIGKSTLPEMQDRCLALGLMKETDGKKIRLFDLRDFCLLE